MTTQEIILIILFILFLFFMFLILPYFNICGGLHLEFLSFDQRSQCNNYQMIHGCVGDKFNANGEFLYNTFGNDNRTGCGYFIDIWNYDNMVLKTEEMNQRHKENLLIFLLVPSLLTIGYLGFKIYDRLKKNDYKKI